MEKIFFLIFVLLFTMPKVFANREEQSTELEGSSLPSGVLTFDDKMREFSVKPNVVKNFGISSNKINSSGGLWTVSKESIVYSLDKTTIFQRKVNTFKIITVKVVKDQGSFVVISLASNAESLDIVNQGTKFLQTVYLSLEEGTSQSH